MAVADDAAAENTLAVHGERGALHLDLLRFDGLRRVARSDYPVDPAARLRKLAVSLADPGGAVRAAREGGEFALSYVEQWRHFARVVRGEEAPRASLADGRAALEIALAAVESAESGAFVRLGPGRVAA